ncbi:Kelch repeat-containing protein, partial [[Eubacterium] cellulosolvens]
MLTFSGLIIFTPTIPMISSAVDTPTVTERADNDFINGTCDKVQVIKTCKGNELRLDTYEDCTWLYLNPATKPPARDDHMMAAVWGTDKIVMYGGRNFVSARYNDTWVYDLSDNTWTQKFPIDNPGHRDATSMAAIWGTDKVLIFGGAGGLSNNDTWIYDLSDNNWTRKYPANRPNEMHMQTLTSISCTDKVLLFGGIYNLGGIYSNDTWIYDLSDNNWTLMNTDPKPDARADYGMSFIYNTDKVVLFGGGFQSGPSYLNDTWIYDLSDNKWTEAIVTKQPAPSSSNGMAAIYGTDKIVIFIGSTTTGPKNQTWIYDLSDNTWTEMFPINPPSIRIHFRLDSVFGTNKVIMFGGSTPWTDESWEFKLLNYYYKGSYISPPYYIGPNASFKTISWNGSVATNTSIKFQLRTANSELELNTEEFLGFDGTSGTYYTITPSSTWPGHNNQSWFQYKAYLFTTNYNETPILRNVSWTYNYWPNTTLVNPDYGSVRVDNRPSFVWNFTDRDSIFQEAFQVIIDNDYGFQSIDYDSGEQYGNASTWQFPNGTSYTTLSDGTWYWKARTKDNDGDWGLFSPPWKLIIDTKPPNST